MYIIYVFYFMFGFSSNLKIDLLLHHLHVIFFLGDLNNLY
jgi:hypothetical protein